MERRTAQDFDQELLLIFDQHVHGAIDRRGFLDRATKFAVGGMTSGGDERIYAGTQHGFNNDTTPRYDAAAAKLAWERTTAHFNKYVRG